MIDETRIRTILYVIADTKKYHMSINEFIKEIKSWNLEAKVIKDYLENIREMGKEGYLTIAKYEDEKHIHITDKAKRKYGINI